MVNYITDKKLVLLGREFCSLGKSHETIQFHHEFPETKLNQTSSLLHTILQKQKEKMGTSHLFSIQLFHCVVNYTSDFLFYFMKLESQKVCQGSIFCCWKPDL